MHFFHRWSGRLALIAALAVLGAGAPPPARAEPDAAPGKPPSPTSQRHPPSSSSGDARPQAPAVTAGEPEVRHAVVEDDSARIEETRVRGQVQRISVTPKGGKAASYLILPGDASGSESSRSGAGKRVWNVWQF